jgi:membrane-bound ClpP family serine protease
MLFQNAQGFHTSKPLVISVAVALGAVWVFAISKAVEVRHRPVEVGAQLIAGSVGEVRENGLVFVNGELWEARTAHGEELHRGDKVRVESLDGLVLTVRPEGT